MKRRYSDNDRHFGPFTLSKHTSRPLGAVLDSGGGMDDQDPRCHVKLHGFGYTLICELPRLVLPRRMWVSTGHYSWAKSPSDGYWDVHPREYGFSLNGGFLQVFLGAQTMDSSTTQSWNKFLPWTQWRHVRFSIYDRDGRHYWTEAQRERHEVRLAVQETSPVVVFEFDDYDGRRIQAKTRIEEREWLFGEGWFKWLSVFRRPMIRRSLDLDFSEEVGPEKGSWKGGTVGHSIEILPGELHEAAFRRYCDQEHNARGHKYRIRYVGTVDRAALDSRRAPEQPK